MWEKKGTGPDKMGGDGMIFALSLLEAGESKYSDALAERLKDRLSPEKAGEASAT